MLQGKTALVTGSTSGIGLGIACALARSGANVVLNGFGDVAAARAQVQAAGAQANAGAPVQVEHHAANMARASDIEDLAAFSLQRFGRIDILVNNAGIQHVARLENFPPERWDAVLAINLSSAFHTTRLLLPAMQQAGWGRIINIASTHGLVASPEKSAYVAAKHGIIGLSKVTALENASRAITCNAICPGWVLTPLVQQQIEARASAQGIAVEDAKKQLLGEKQPSLQFVTPEEIGELSLFLCSPAAANVRGAAWNIDGGWVAQ